MPKRRRETKTPATPANWLVCFELDIPDAELHVASFQILVRADDPDSALEQCERQLRELRVNGDLFEQPCTVHLVHLIRFPDVVTRPVVINYSNSIIYDTKEDFVGLISCTVPNQGDVDVQGYSVEPDKKGDEIEPFLDFGGLRFRRALNKALGRPDDPERTDAEREAVRRVLAELDEPEPKPPPRRRRRRGRSTPDVP